MKNPTIQDAATVWTLKYPAERRPDHFILSNARRPVEMRSYRNWFDSVLREVGIPHMKFHSLRHTFATRCINSDYDYKTVSALLGHADISTTLDLYVHPDLERKRRCIEKVFP